MEAVFRETAPARGQPPAGERELCFVSSVRLLLPLRPRGPVPAGSAEPGDLPTRGGAGGRVRSVSFLLFFFLVCVLRSGAAILQLRRSANIHDTCVIPT